MCNPYRRLFHDPDEDEDTCTRSEMPFSELRKLTATSFHKEAPQIKLKPNCETKP